MKVLMLIAQNAQTNKSIYNKANNSNPAFKSTLTGEFPSLENELNRALSVYTSYMNKCKELDFMNETSRSAEDAFIDTAHEQAFCEHFNANNKLCRLLQETTGRITNVLNQMKNIKKDGIKREIKMQSIGGSTNILIDDAKKATIFPTPWGPGDVARGIITGQDTKLEEFFNNLITND